MRIVFLVGGYRGHPVSEQARAVLRWLGGGHDAVLADGPEAFDQLDGADLLVLMGHYRTGIPDPPYRAPTEAQRAAFRRYVGAGRPLIAHHGSVAGFDDWPEYGGSIGVRWIWGQGSHSPLGRYRVRITAPDHPVTRGVDDMEIEDEVYYDLWLHPQARVHAVTDWQGRPRPMVVTLEGADAPGAGRHLYLANGHDLRAFASPGLQSLWQNGVAWVTGGD